MPACRRGSRQAARAAAPHCVPVFVSFSLAHCPMLIVGRAGGALAPPARRTQGRTPSPGWRADWRSERPLLAPNLIPLSRFHNTHNQGAAPRRAPPSCHWPCLPPSLHRCPPAPLGSSAHLPSAAAPPSCYQTRCCCDSSRLCSDDRHTPLSHCCFGWAGVCACGAGGPTAAPAHPQRLAVVGGPRSRAVRPRAATWRPARPATSYAMLEARFVTLQFGSQAPLAPRA